MKGLPLAVIIRTLAIVIYISFTVVSARSTANASQILKSLLDANYYDQRLRPNFEGAPVEVSVNIDVTAIGGLNEQEMQFGCTFFLRQTWKDPRLAFENIYKTRNLTLSGDIMSQIWKPDTYINNGKSSKAPPKQFLLKIFSDGTVIYSQRMTVVATCMMYLLNYPMDKQYCSISFESYGMNTDDLILSWDSEAHKESINIKDEVTLSQFALDEYTAEKNLAYYPTGTFTILKLTFLIRRKKFYYVVQTYIPAMCITMLSWVTFWIPRSSPPARVVLGITTVLSLTTLISGSQQFMPRVSYVKAIDWFLMISFLFVFGALIEYPSSMYIERQAKKKCKTGTRVFRLCTTKKAQYAESSDPSKESHMQDVEKAKGKMGEKMQFDAVTERIAVDTQIHDIPNEGSKDQLGDKAKTDLEIGNIVDRYARVLFPLLYFLYNAAYWTVYLFEIDLLL